MRYERSILGFMATSATIALLGGTAAAQTAAPAADVVDQTNQDIIVTGIRGGVISAIEAKKKLDVIADVVTAQDIGKFPDTNIAESLQRITGVQITREAGEGKFVSVRGLPPEFNVVTINGHYLANTAVDQSTQASDRRFDFSILPPDFIQALEVYKTPRADLDEGGVSSTINIKTLRPLELGKRVLSASAEGQYEGNSKKWSPKVSGVYSDTFLDGRLGIAVSGVYNQRKYTELSTTAGQLDPITFSAAQIQPGVPLTAGKNYLMVDSIGRTRTDSTRTRKTFAATVQFEPVDHLRFTAEGLYADFKGDSHVAGFTSRPIYGVQYSKSPVTQATVDANNVITSLQTTDSAVEVSAYDNRERNTIKSGSADMTFDDGVTFARLKGAYSEATARIDGVGLDYFIWGPISTTTIPGGYVMDPNDPIVKIVIPTGVPTPSQFPLNQAGNNDLNRSDRSFEFQGDFARDLGAGFLRKIRLGFKVSARKRTNSSEFLYDPRLHGLPATSYAAGTVDASLSSYSGSSLNFTNFPNVNPQIYLDACCGGSLSTWQSQVRTRTGVFQVFENPGLDYTVTEDTQAGYALLDFGGKESAISGNVGVRVVNTDQSVNTASVDLAQIKPSLSSTVPPAIPVSAPLTLSRSYLDMLPSFNVTWALADRKVLIRGAVAKVLSRPNLDALVPRYSIDTSKTPFAISGGNPDLKPYHSWQYDLSIEYYPKPGTILSLAAFQKNIDSFIYSGTRTFTAGQYTFNQVLPINGAPATLRGVEANATTFFDFLPSPLDGFGAQINGTFADGKIKADPANGLSARKFEGLSKWTYNLVLFYEKSGFSARAAYNYRSDYTAAADLRGGHIESQGVKAFSTVDGQVGYDITRNVSVYAQGINLLNQASISYVQLLSNGAKYPLDYTQTGRRVIVGVRVKL